MGFDPGVIGFGTRQQPPCRGYPSYDLANRFVAMAGTVPAP